MQVSEKTLIIGVDIAEMNHVARAQDFRGVELGKGLCSRIQETDYADSFNG